jgi:hypothetical protein
MPFGSAVRGTATALTRLLLPVGCSRREIEELVGRLAEGEAASLGVEDDNAEPFVWTKSKATSPVSL